MKKIFTLLLCSALFAGSCWGDVVVCTGSKTTSSKMPFATGTGSGYSISQQIYTKAELLAAGLTAGEIKGIQFCYASTSAYERQWDIYITKPIKGTEEKSTYKYNEFYPAGTLVYSGSISVPSSQTWYGAKTLTTSYSWDGQSNIMVTIYDRTGTTISFTRNDSTFNATDQGVYIFNSSSAYNISNITTYSPTKSTSIPKIKFITGQSAPTPKITVPSNASFGTFDAQYEKDSTTFIVKGSDLKGDVTLSAAAGLEVDPTSITKEAIVAAGSTGVSVKVRSTHAFAFNSPKVTVSSQNATSQTVTVSGTQASYATVQTIPALYSTTVGSYSNFTESATIKSIEGNTLTIGTGSNTCHIDFTSVPGSYAANGTIKNIKLKTTGSGTFKAFTFSYTAPVVKGITIYDDKDNTDTIEAYKGQSVTVNINRSFVKDSYNTICLPFSISKTAFAGKFGIGSSVIRLASSSYNEGVISLTFQELIDSETLSAGTPYLIKPLNNVTNPAFENYTISADLDTVETTYVDFIGLINPTALPQSKEILFMGSGNELFWPTEAGTLKGLRCYFKVKFEGTPITAGAPVRMIVNKDNSTTELIEMQNATPISDVHKFVYNGQLIIIRNGVRYNINGQMIK